VSRKGSGEATDENENQGCVREATKEEVDHKVC